MIDEALHHSLCVENMEGINLAAKVEAAIRGKSSGEEIQAILREANDEEQNEQFSPLQVTVFVQTLLNMGSKSFSHSFAAIAKFHTVLKVSYLI